MDYIIRIIKSIEYSGMLTVGISETIKHEVKSQEGGFLGMLLETLGASMLGNMLTRRGVMRAGKRFARPGTRHSNNMGKLFCLAPSFKQY